MNNSQVKFLKLKFVKISCFLPVILIITVISGKLNAMNQLFAGTNENGEISILRVSIDMAMEKIEKSVSVKKDAGPCSLASLFNSIFCPRVTSKDLKIKMLYKHKVAVLKGYQDSKLAFSSINKNIVAYNCQNGDIVVYDISKNKEIALLKGHTGKVNSIDFSFFDKNILISGSDDKFVRIWDISKPDGCKCIKILNGHASPIFNVIFSPVSPYFCASVSVDGAVIIWDVSANSDKQAVIKAFSIDSRTESDLLFSINSLKFSTFFTHIIVYYERTRGDSLVKILDFSKKSEDDDGKDEGDIVGTLGLSKLLPGCGGFESSMMLKSLDSIKLLAFSRLDPKKVLAYGFENNIFGSNFTENIFIYNMFKNKNIVYLGQDSQELPPDNILQSKDYECKDKDGCGIIASEMQFDVFNKNRIFTISQDGSKIKVYDIAREKHLETIETGEVFCKGSVSFLQDCEFGEIKFKKALIESIERVKNKNLCDVRVSCEN